MNESTQEELPAAAEQAARLLARALIELQKPILAGNEAMAAELAAARQAMDRLARALSEQATTDREQRLLLASQLTHLASALDALVGHLEGLSRLMAGVLEKLETPEPATVPAVKSASDPCFQPGGEGVSLTLTNVPGFQALMDLQQAIAGLDAVEAASVERFQQGDSRLLLRLRAPLSASELAAAAGRATGLTIVIEESKPELASLRLKVV